MAWPFRKGKWSKYTRRKAPAKRSYARRPTGIRGQAWGASRSPALGRQVAWKRGFLSTTCSLGPSGYIYPNTATWAPGSNELNVAQLFAQSSLGIRLATGVVYREYRVRRFRARWTPIFSNYTDALGASAQYQQSYVMYSYSAQAVSNSGSNVTIPVQGERENAKSFSIWCDHEWSTPVTGSTGGAADWDACVNISNSSPVSQWGAVCFNADTLGAPSVSPVYMGQWSFTFEVELRTAVF